MASGLLSLKWNHHRTTFLHVLSTIRAKESYSDVTIACDGKFYPVHKLVLSTCSEYFEQMFERTQCKHPVVVLKDIHSDDLEALLNYMYIGEVNVLQDKLSSLIKAAENLRIKGLAVADEDPKSRETNTNKDYNSSSNNKRSQSRGHDSPLSKRRRREDEVRIDEGPQRRRKDDDLEGRTSISSHSESHQEKEPYHSSEEKSSPVKKNRLSVSSPRSVMSPGDGGHSNTSIDDIPVPTPSTEENPDPVQAEEAITEILLEEAGVKVEPPEDFTQNQNEDTTNEDNKNFFLSDNMDNYDMHEPHDDSSDMSHQAPGLTSDVKAGSSGLQAASSSGVWEDNVSGPSNADASSGLLSHIKLDEFEDNNKSSLMPLLDWNFPISTSYSDTSTHDTPMASIDGFYNCSPCSFQTAIRDEYIEHIQTHKPFQCNYCSFKCALKGNLKAHMNIHTRKMAFKCDICPYRTPRKADLIRHLKIHTDDRTYRCEFCSYTCREEVRYNSHMTTHYSNSYSCPKCPYRTLYKFAMNRHFKTQHISEEFESTSQPIDSSINQSTDQAQDFP